MKIQVNAFCFFGDYGFSFHIGKRCGNYTSKLVRPIAKLVWKIFGKRDIINIGKKSKVTSRSLGDAGKGGGE